MNGLHFEFEWENPLGAGGPELRATWAHLAITVNGIPVTQVHDYNARSVRDGIYLPLYPLAEWLAMHWWPLLFELETPRRPVYVEYTQRHTIRFGREGFALPDLTFRPSGEGKISLDWKSYDLPECGVRFLQQGSTMLKVSEVREAFAALINGVIKRMECERIVAVPLIDEWQAICETNQEEREFCTAAATLGLDPYDLPEALASSIIRVNAMLPVEMLPEFFPAADAQALEEQAKTLLLGIRAAQDQTADLRSLKELKKAAAQFNPSGTPWQEGYAFARTLRENLALGDRVATSLNEVGGLFGVNSAELQAAMPVVSPPAFCDALVAENSQNSPGFIIGKQRESSRSFALCRSIFEYLTSALPAPLLITSTQSVRQKRSRAFAAEFLAPASLLRKRLPVGTLDTEDVDELAAEFHVSPYIIAHQLENHRIARIFIS
jgi:hypothetical protein